MGTNDALVPHLEEFYRIDLKYQEKRLMNWE
jgi:hypothetical protein